MIDSINKAGGLYPSQTKDTVSSKYKTVAETSPKSSAKQSDRLELSDEAKRLQPIINKLQSGFYDKDENIRKVAAKINNELPL